MRDDTHSIAFDSTQNHKCSDVNSAHSHTYKTNTLNINTNTQHTDSGTPHISIHLLRPCIGDIHRCSLVCILTFLLFAKTIFIRSHNSLYLIQLHYFVSSFRNFTADFLCDLRHLYFDKQRVSSIPFCFVIFCLKFRVTELKCEHEKSRQEVSNEPINKENKWNRVWEWKRFLLCRQFSSWFKAPSQDHLDQDNLSILLLELVLKRQLSISIVKPFFDTKNSMNRIVCFANVPEFK